MAKTVKMKMRNLLRELASMMRSINVSRTGPEDCGELLIAKSSGRVEKSLPSQRHLWKGVAHADRLHRSDLEGGRAIRGACDAAGCGQFGTEPGSGAASSGRSGAGLCG